MIGSAEKTQMPTKGCTYFTVCFKALQRKKKMHLVKTISLLLLLRGEDNKQGNAPNNYYVRLTKKIPHQLL